MIWVMNRLALDKRGLDLVSVEGLGSSGSSDVWTAHRTQNTEHRTQNTEQQHDKHRNQECVSEEGDTRMDVMYKALRKVTHPNIALDFAVLFPASTNQLLNLDQE